MKAFKVILNNSLTCFDGFEHYFATEQGVINYVFDVCSKRSCAPKGGKFYIECRKDEITPASLFDYVINNNYWHTIRHEPVASDNNDVFTLFGFHYKPKIEYYHILFIDIEDI